MKTNLSGYQYRILWAIIRKTWGWHKTKAEISLPEFEKLTGITRAHICRARKELQMRNIITLSGNEITFNGNYSQWRALPIGARGYIVAHPGKKPLPIGARATSIKNNKIDNPPISPHRGDLWEIFWREWPRKEAKKAAIKAWNKIEPGEALFTTIMSALDVQKQTEQWKKDDGEFIPHPATWLNGERWQDETKITDREALIDEIFKKYAGASK